MTAGDEGRVHTEEVNIDPGVAKENPDLAKQAVQAQYKISVLGMVLGLLCIIGGLGLLFWGVSGNVSWSVKVFGFDSKLADAAPGVVLFIVGALIIYFSRFEVTIAGKSSAKAKGKRKIH